MKYINDTQALRQDCGKAAASKESNNEDFKNSLWDLHEPCGTYTKSTSYGIKNKFCSKLKSFLIYPTQ